MLFRSATLPSLGNVARVSEATGETTERIHVTRSRARPGGIAAEKVEGRPFRERKPPWLKVPAPGGPTYRRLKGMIREENLNTVCEEARCPNIGECWDHRAATFMILGDVCTRRCGFCAVTSGRPPAPPDPDEPRHVAEAVQAMGLSINPAPIMM